ncbi:MAG: hypothetical protein KC445_03830 [Anaerolineales bacterium]|nr:hypothetical protein [Anaerolineales bacterium]
MSEFKKSNRVKDQQLRNIAWALFLIMLGGLWLVPHAWIPPGTWSLGVGLTLLGLNAARHYYGIPICLSTVIIGLVALACGLGGFFWLGLPLLPILMILFGASLLLNGRFNLN